MKILVVSHVAAIWGAQRRLLDVAPRLAEQGIKMVLAGPQGDLTEAWQSLGLSVRPIDLGADRGLWRADGSGRRRGPVGLAREAGRVQAAAWRLARLARDCDILQSHSLYAHLEVALAGKLARRPVLLDVHDFVNPGPGRRLLRFASRLATLAVANSKAIAATLGETVAVRVIYPGVDLNRFHPGPPPPGMREALAAHPQDPIVGIVGRVDPRKGVDTLVEAMIRLRDTGTAASLVVIGREFVGTPQWARELRARAEQELGSRVRFLPPRHDVPNVLRALDVLVNASHHEPFGRTIIEAHAVGTPVVATAAGGIPEFVTDGETGLLVTPRDPDALAAAIKRLLVDPSLRQHLAAAGRAQVTDRFTLDHHVSSLISAYRALSRMRRPN